MGGAGWAERGARFEVAAISGKRAHPPQRRIRRIARTAAELAISALCRSSRYSSVHMLSDATRTAALAAKSDANAGMSPSLRCDTRPLLIIVVKGIGDADVQLDGIEDR